MVQLAPMELDEQVKRHVRSVNFGKAARLRNRVFEVPNWKRWSVKRQLAFIRSFIDTTARDPHIAELAADIVRASPTAWGQGQRPRPAAQRDYRAQWALLLLWVQTHLYYVNEPAERLQSPQYTISAGFGDCDDLAIALAALGSSLRLPYKLTVSGRRRGRRVRYVESSRPLPRGVKWAHIYLAVGWPPFKPTKWAFAEPTLPVPLGWDVLTDDRHKLPELAARAARVERSGTILGQPDEAEEPPPDKRRAPAVVRFIADLDWPGIVGAALPAVLSAVLIQRVLRPGAGQGQQCPAPARTNPPAAPLAGFAGLVLAAAAVGMARRKAG